jgi:hypothetical protein
MTSGQFPDLLRVGQGVPDLLRGQKTMKKRIPKEVIRSDEGKKKVERVMREFKRGTLRSSSGQKVKNRKQAIAIALSEAYRKVMGK